MRETHGVSRPWTLRQLIALEATTGARALQTSLTAAPYNPAYMGLSSVSLGSVDPEYGE